MVFFILTAAYCLKLVGLGPVWQMSALIDVLKAGFVSWLPAVIATLGHWLGVLMVFGIVGAVETGHYYVALAIASVVLMIATSLTGLLLPVLSGMEDGRERAASRVLRISLAFMMPVAVFIGLHPWLPPELAGTSVCRCQPHTVNAVAELRPLALSSCVSSLLYAYGRYDLVLRVGLAQNLSAVTSYFLLVPSLGGLGAAISYALGSLAALIAAIFAGRAVNFSFDFKGLARVPTPALVAGLACWVSGAHWAIALVVIASLSLLSYAKLGVIGRSDLREIAYALLSKEMANRLGERTRPVLDLLYGPHRAQRDHEERLKTAEEDEEPSRGS